MPRGLARPNDEYPTMNDEKYVVFKHKDVVPHEDGSGVLIVHRNEILDDAVVIRTQDVFAVSGLRAYRDTMLTHRNLLFSMMESWEALALLPGLQGEMRQRLKNLDIAIEYFTEVTIEAEDRFNRGDVKVPD